MNLTDEEIRIKVAEAQGWRDLKTTWEGYHEWMHPDGRVRYGTKTCKAACLPNYPEDLNACSTFEATLTDEEQASYVRWLNVSHPTADIFYPDQSERGFNNKLAREVFGLVSATARQRCLAYLKTKRLIP